jgi:phosphohistidine phosphatase
MARQLWLLRHADAEPHGTREDSERRLTERGERQARLAGVAIALMGVEFTTLLSSPKERALRTATVAAQAWNEQQRVEVEIYSPLAEGFDARQALAVMSASPSHPLPAGETAPPARVLLVGHEPDLSTVVAELTGARIDLKKGGLAVVRIDGPGGELLALLRPSELALIAGEGKAEAVASRSR